LHLWHYPCELLTLLGHAGAVVQARQLGDELYVGVHSDEAILENKGPTVMNLKERYILTLLPLLSHPSTTFLYHLYFPHKD